MSTPDAAIERETTAGDVAGEAGAGGDAPHAAGPAHEIPAYADLRYRDVFWAARPYEDMADRTAIRTLLPHMGDRLMEVGAGYGRLAHEYRGYRQVVLFDASDAHVGAARERFRDEPWVEVVQGDAYSLPFDGASFDTVVCVRVMHHLEHPAAVIGELARVLRPGGVLVLEFANKRHLKAMLKYGLGRQPWSPYTLEPHEYRPLHFDRHPAEMRRLLERAGLRVDRVLTASLFRLPALTRRAPARLLATIERPLQTLLSPVTPGPSVFMRARKPS
jgi:SAM-dependent methyltransferase